MAKLSSKTGKGKNAKSLANLKNSKSKQISLSGKETIAQLKEILLKSGAKNNIYEGIDKILDAYDLRKDSKNELLSKVKMFNVSLETGGGGNINTFSNDIVSKYYLEVIDKLRESKEFKALSKNNIGDIKNKIIEEMDTLKKKKYLGTISKSEKNMFYKDSIEIIKKNTDLNYKKPN